jgi:hypothetical protein
MKSNTSTSQANRVFSTLVLLAALLLAGCAPRARVGTLRSESQSVELGDAKSVRIEIIFGAGDLEIAGSAQKLLEADFTYNVAELTPEVEYADGTLVIRQPESEGLPVLRGITDFRNEWDLRLYNRVPIDLSIDMGAGNSNLKLADLSLSGLDINLGAGKSTVDLNGDWTRDLNVSIDTGAADLALLLPSDIGVRVEVESGPTMIDATGLVQDGGVYTNDAYGVSEVTLHVDIQAGIGQIDLEIEE